MKNYLKIGILAGLVIGMVLMSGCTNNAGSSGAVSTPTPQIVYVTVLVTPIPTPQIVYVAVPVEVLAPQTPTLPPVNTNIMGAVGYITPRPTPTFDPSKYVQPWLGYEDSSGSGYIGNNGNTAAAIHRHETSLVVNTTPKGPTYNTANNEQLFWRSIGPDWAGRSVYAGMTKDELAALLNKSGTFYRDGTVSAWTIKSDRYSGTIEFQAGYGVASVDGYPQVTFSWNEIGDNHYEAHYLWYTVQFTYNPEKDTIISPLFPDAKLER